jgi:hypothetical protein
MRHDHEEMRGWDEPAHFQAVLCSLTEEEIQPSLPGGAHPIETPPAPYAAHPATEARREAITRLLELGASGLEKLACDRDLHAEEMLGIQCLLLVYARPAIRMVGDRLGCPPPLWSELEAVRKDIELVQRGVGRIELMGHPDLDWAGTGFLVHENCLLTTRRTAEIFAENLAGTWQFCSGITAWMDYRSPPANAASAGYHVRGIIGVHERYDLALLEVEAPPATADAPVPVILLGEPPGPLSGRPVYLVGHPARDGRRREAAAISRFFEDAQPVKRVLPGKVRSMVHRLETPLLEYDCTPIGQMTGACLVDRETHQALGIHLSGRFPDTSTAIPLWPLGDDPLFRQAGVTFADARPTELETTLKQVENLSHGPLWTDVRATIAHWHQRALGRQE